MEDESTWVGWIAHGPMDVVCCHCGPTLDEAREAYGRDVPLWQPIYLGTLSDDYECVVCGRPVGPGGEPC